MSECPTPKFQIFAHGRQWYVRFSYDGRQIKRRVGPQGNGTEEEVGRAAEAVVRDYVAQFERAEAACQAHDPFRLYQNRLANRSSSHVENCARFQARLTEFFKNRSLLTLTREDVEAWRDWLLTKAPRNDKGRGELGLSIKTVKEHIEWLAAVFNHAGLRNPTLGVDRPRRTHDEETQALEYFTPEEMEKLFAAADRHPSYRNGFIILAYTGCRIGELLGVRPKDIDEQNHVLSVVGKGRKRRPLTLTGPIASAWEALVRELKTPSIPTKGRKTIERHGFVFPQYKNWGKKMLNVLCHDAFGEIELVEPDGEVKKIQARHGHPHLLRHTLATMALMHFDPAWDLPYLSKWLGHKDISTTYRIYGHLIIKEPPSGYSRTSLEQRKNG